MDSTAERILVTGGMGAIGVWVVRELIERGHRPIVLDPRFDPRLLSGLEGQFDYVRGDVLDLPRLIHLLRERAVDRIIHLAAVLFECEENPPLGLQVNTVGTVNVLEAARITGISRVAFTSAKAVYGQIIGPYANPTYQPVHEDHPKNPDSIYGASKLAAEHFGLHYARRFGIDFVATRLSTLYGPGRLARHGAVALTSEIVEMARAGRPVRIERGADQGDDLLYTKDVAHGIVLAAITDPLEDRVFNIGSGRVTRLQDLVDVVRELFPAASIEVGPGLDPWGMGKQYYCVLDVTRARQQLGFEPQYSLADGVRDYIGTLEAFERS